MTTDDRLEWRTSSYSGNGENCVQVAPVAGWRDSASAAGDEDRGNSPSGQRPIFVRHSKHPEAGIIEFSPASWTAFLQEIRSGADSQNGSASVMFNGTDTLVQACETDVRLQFDNGEWLAFRAAIEDGEFDTLRFAR